MSWSSDVLSFLTFEHFSSVLNFLWKWASKFLVLNFLLNLVKNAIFPCKIEKIFHSLTKDICITVLNTWPIHYSWHSYRYIRIYGVGSVGGQGVVTLAAIIPICSQQLYKLDYLAGAVIYKQRQSYRFWPEGEGINPFSYGLSDQA